MSASRRHLHRFGPFCLNATERVLANPQGPVDLTPKAIDTLTALVERRGQVVTKDQIRAAVWGAGVHVEPNSVERQISDVRKGIGHGQEERYIEIVAKRGYRFLAPVEELWEDVAPSADPEPIAARSCYARCLAAQGKVANANRISSSLVKGLQKVEDVALRSSA